MPKSRAVGIDLGTTYSAMAWIDEAGKSELIPNEEGDLLTPSVVLFEDENVIVGKEAKKVAVMHADRVAICVKRDMGKPVFSTPINGQYLPPEVIQSYLLRKLKKDVSRKVGPDFQAIITVPAYFDEPRRKATYQAGQIAGLNVLDILNEPTAAALAFGEVQGYLTRFGAPRAPMKVLVYDLGGGTFDVTLIDLQAGDLKTICTDGDVQLGGHDWDMRLVDYMAGEFIREIGDDPRKSPASMQRMLAAAEEGKHTLSVRPRAKLHVTHNGRAIDVTVTREKFEEMSADLLERTRYTTRQLLVTAGIEWKDVDRMLLTGGSTRMPMVLCMLKELTGIEPDQSISPDEAVARGAAVYAQYLLAAKGETGHQPDFDVTNVNAHSLGIEGIDPTTGRKRNNIIIPRNTPLPTKKKTECVTKKDSQRTVVVKVLEGESLDPAECSAIGRTVIRNLPPGLAKGWPIEVVYEYAVNGRLQVRAKVRGTNNEVVLELERDASMSSSRLNQWKRVVAGSGGLDAFDMAIAEELNELKKQAPQRDGARSSPASSAKPTSPQPTSGPTSQPTSPPPKLLQPLPIKNTPASAQPTGQVKSQPTSGQPSTSKPTGQSAAASGGGATPQPQVGQPQMMAFTCPHCRSVFQVPAALAGKRANCPGCNGVLIVPKAQNRG